MLTISLITSFLSAIFGGVFLTWYALYAKKNNKMNGQILILLHIHYGIQN